MKKFLSCMLAIALVLTLSTGALAFQSRATQSGLKMTATVDEMTATVAATWYPIGANMVIDPTQPAVNTASFGTIDPNSIADPDQGLLVDVEGNNAGWGVALYVQNYNTTNNSFVAATKPDLTATSDVNEYESWLLNSPKGLVYADDGLQAMNLRWIATGTVGNLTYPSGNTPYRVATDPVDGNTLDLATMWTDAGERGWKWIIDASTENSFLRQRYLDNVKEKPTDEAGLRDYATFMNALNAGEYVDGQAFIYFLTDSTGATTGSYGTDTLTVEFYSE